MKLRYKAAAAAGIILAVSVVYGISRGQGVEAEEYRVIKQSYSDTYTENGIVRSGAKLHVLSGLSAEVSEVYVSENSRVKKGDLLVSLDKTDTRYEIAMHEGSLNSYKAKLEQSDIGRLMESSPEEYLKSMTQERIRAEAVYKAALTGYEAASSLLESGAVSRYETEKSRADYEAAKTAYEAAAAREAESRNYLNELNARGLATADINRKFYESSRAQISAAIGIEEAALEKLHKQLEDCDIRAERDGIISSLPVKEMSMVSAGSELLCISGETADTILIEADVLTEAIPYLKEGDETGIRLKLRGEDREFRGIISAIYDFASEGLSAIGLSEYRVRTEIVCEDAAAKELLNEGFGVEVEFELYKSAEALTVPSQAVYEYENRNYVLAIENGRAREREIKLAYISGEGAVVESGLSEGESIIANVNKEGLKDGVKLKLK